MTFPDVDFDALPNEPVAPNGDTTTVNDLTCSECGRDDFKNARGLSRHMSVTHGIKREKDDSKPTSLRRGNLEKELTEFFMMIAMMVSMVNPTDGSIVGGNAERLAHAYANLARQNKAFRNFLEGMMKTGAMGEVFTATLFTALPILGNHGKLPAEVMAFFGAPQMPTE